MDVNTSKFQDNHAKSGGGIANYGGEVIITRSTLQDNASEFFGGAIYNHKAAYADKGKLSIIHSAIEYKDGSVIAQLGLPSMHIPIQYAITYPERFEGIKSKSFSFSEIARLDFEEPDYEKFPTVKLAYHAGNTGGSATVCLNAANEEAVFAFLNNEIKLFDIYKITEKMMSSHKVIQNPDIDEIFEIDKEVRILTKENIKRVCSK